MKLEIFTIFLYHCFSHYCAVLLQFRIVQCCSVMYEQSSVATRSILPGRTLSADSEGWVLTGTGKQSSSSFQTTAAVNGVSNFSFAISELYERQETAMLAFSFEMFHICREVLFKRLFLQSFEQK